MDYYKINIKSPFSVGDDDCIYTKTDPYSPWGLRLYNRITKEIIDVFRQWSEEPFIEWKTEFIQEAPPTLGMYGESIVDDYNARNPIGTNIDDEWVIVCLNCNTVQPIKEWTGSLPANIHRCTECFITDPDHYKIKF